MAEVIAGVTTKDCMFEASAESLRTHVVRAGKLLVLASLAFATPASATEGRWASNDNVAKAHTKAGSTAGLVPEQ